MKEAIFFCIVGLPLFGKEGSWTPVFKILVRALCYIRYFLLKQYFCAMLCVYAFKQLVGENEIDYHLSAKKLDWKYCIFKHLI